MADLEQKLEALLFVAGEPVGLGRLAKILKAEGEKIKSALAELSKRLEGRGLRLAEKDGEYTLVTAPEVGKLAESFLKAELGEELSRALLETLSIIVYKGPVSRSEVDYIRGVNSVWTLRNLMMRGLVERVVSQKDSRVWLYRPSFEFLKYMGIEKLEKLPEYNEFRQELEEFLRTEEEFKKKEL